MMTVQRSSRTLCFVLALQLLVGCGGSSESPDSGHGGATVASLRDELRANPDDPQLRLRLGRLYLSDGDGAAAESHLRRALSLGSADAEAQPDLVRSLLLQNKHFEALEMLKPMMPADGPAPARLWLLLGEAQLGLPNFDRKAIRQSFLEAFRALTAEGEPATHARLEDLIASEPIVGSARRHIACYEDAVALIEPTAIEDLPRPDHVLRVGPGRDLKTPSQAVAQARDGDLIEIDAGVYRGDVAVWTQNDLTLRGVGGMVQLEAAGRHAAGKAIWVFEGDNITAENIEFSGARVPDRNGAGIRLSGDGATIRNCNFHDNENGFLGGIGSEKDILIEFSRFERNGYGDGQTHNIYIGVARRFILRYSYSNAAHVGHLVKSRAHENIILFNRITDGDAGDSSYVINLPEGGRAWIVGNELQQGRRAQNPIMISFGEDRADRDDQALFVVNNTLYNHILDGTIVRNATVFDATLANNMIAGAPAVLLQGPGVIVTNEQRAGPWLRDADGFDYRLAAEAPAIDRGTDPATIAGLRYLPDAEYRHPARGQSRKAVATIDIGAREFCGF